MKNNSSTAAVPTVSSFRSRNRFEDVAGRSVNSGPLRTEPILCIFTRCNSQAEAIALCRVYGLKGAKPYGAEKLNQVWMYLPQSEKGKALALHYACIGFICVGDGT